MWKKMIDPKKVFKVAFIGIIIYSLMATVLVLKLGFECTRKILGLISSMIGLPITLTNLFGLKYILDENKIINEALIEAGNIDCIADKVTKYYTDLTNVKIDDCKTANTLIKVLYILNNEEILRDWIKKHPNKSTIMQPAETALNLIDDLRKQGVLK
jgi:hypothetical protein